MTLTAHTRAARQADEAGVQSITNKGVMAPGRVRMPGIGDTEPVVRWDEIDRILNAHGSLEDVANDIRQRFPADHFDRLAVTVEAEIIPRLMMMYRGDGASPDAVAHADHAVTAEDVDRLTGFVLRPDAAPALDYVTSLMARGARVETILLKLLSPVARRLGEMWDEDVHSFVEVTTGLSRLQQLLRIVGSAVGCLGERDNHRFRALFAPSPGDQHTFGIFIVEQFFRYDGWTVEVAPQLSTTEIAEAVAEDWYTMLGFSLSCSHFAGRLAVTIERARAASANPDLRILVGGHAFLEDPDLVTQVGADAMARDGQDAVARAHGLPLAAVRHA